MKLFIKQHWITWTAVLLLPTVYFILMAVLKNETVSEDPMNSIVPESEIESTGESVGGDINLLILFKTAPVINDNLRLI